MAISVAARRGLAFALRSKNAADEIVEMIDGQAGGTLSASTKRRLELGFVDEETAAEMVTLVESAGATASANLHNRLGIMLAARYLADEIVEAADFA